MGDFIWIETTFSVDVGAFILLAFLWLIIFLGTSRPTIDYLYLAGDGWDLRSVESDTIGRNSFGNGDILGVVGEGGFGKRSFD
jgi:hypothetical protein